MTSEEVVESFVAAINAGDLNRLTELMTGDHTFIDSDGEHYRGKDRMHEGWRDYFELVSDFHIEIIEKYSRGNRVVLTGIAAGTFSRKGELLPENHWKVPAAWRAETRDDRVEVWQLYVNPEPMRKILDAMDTS